MTAEASLSGDQRRIGFGATLASEWTKLWSVRSTWVSVGLALVLPVALAALLGVSIGATADDPQMQIDAFDPILFSLPGSIFILILLSVLGVMFVSSEYSSGMIRLTLTVTPQRGRILAAKALIIGLVALVAGTVATVAMFLVSQAIFGSYDLPTVSLEDPDAVRAVAGVSLTAPVFPLIAVALGFLLRSTAGAITAVLGIVFLPDVLAPLLPAWWQENVLVYLPSAASDAVSIGHLEQVPFALDQAPAIAVTVGWVAAFLVLAYVALGRRDA
ncbi:MAG TPA: ABC transporter permease subunit [Candidatus Angelobacter sp.]|nr:ABC transporter permease subunit [Candidatus Angelobacter sp.]